MKYLIFPLLLLLGVSHLCAQVTIGSGIQPVRAALLELKDTETGVINEVTDDGNVTSVTGGMVLPRVKLGNVATLEPFIPVGDPDWVNATTSKIKQKHAGLMVYNLRTTGGFSQGVYIWDGNLWKPVGEGISTPNTPQDKYFYLPSFNLPLSTNSSEVLYVDLYAVYQNQFTKAENTSFVSSNPALEQVTTLYGAIHLDYVVTAYDKTLINILAISDDGVLYYQALQPTAPEGSFINIVLVVK
ncbi:hypothetical protein [Dysgonomonas sp. 25]|uniref:hypothetical protein n=1 Tax=Dysgonomonas sp. 25 TaxID=2302933 RepID=UPI0013D351A3|nr:hypothetical protein [Dysgonomonas sp. 25]NDV69453.1 hypothetical protein [Dysgonomonas sp. 25]